MDSINPYINSTRSDISCMLYSTSLLTDLSTPTPSPCDNCYLIIEGYKSLRCDKVAKTKLPDLVFLHVGSEIRRLLGKYGRPCVGTTDTFPFRIFQTGHLKRVGIIRQRVAGSHIKKKYHPILTHTRPYGTCCEELSAFWFPYALSHPTTQPPPYDDDFQKRNTFTSPNALLRNFKHPIHESRWSFLIIFRGNV